ncbi:MAG: c-type cytochrome [Gammaproteobacteria bacterium]|jgi:mono/diheme cytochrome c family protein|nr:c-type cytochrome [Gammaproteobacteria bacterium]MBU0771996.1 c-type cytochrome [Gammaproteobacteria bacterium]MBU0857038.1 c-type cytochrome [Gammaproteobacteria bacterium]MBU1845757.1 c-type cytochrome [Gammaproteobacteria bacterium]
MKRIAVISLILLALAATAGALWLDARNDATEAPRGPVSATEGMIARGEYLARAGNCMACHTARGGAPWAGGRAIDTPFGTFYTSNLTPDADTGLGKWSADDFRAALHEGRSRDGRLLYPAFPYPNYTRITRADSDALWAYLRSLPAVSRTNREHALRFPYDSQTALAAWRALYFKPAEYEADPAQSAQWNRGAYLVQGLGHCSACHASRNALGASVAAEQLAGGLMPEQNWYAPALTSPHEASVSGWPREDVVALLRDGMTKKGASAVGPMAEVVFGSTQHLSGPDLVAMADYLQSLPVSDTERVRHSGLRDELRQERGARLYADNCASCHGDDGKGVAGIYPALAGNRAVTMDPPANPLRVVLGGAFAPATAGNPRPFGMPPFAASLSDEEIALVVSFIRTAWNNGAAPVTSLDVQRYRGNLR